MTEAEAVTLEDIQRELAELRATLTPIVEFVGMLQAAIQNHPMASMLLK